MQFTALTELMQINFSEKFDLSSCPIINKSLILLLYPDFIALLILHYPTVMQLLIANILEKIKSLFTKKTWNGIVAQFYSPDQSDELKAFSAAFGIFMGIIPIWGFQTIAAIFLAVTFKLNKALVIVFSQVSFPAIFPLMVWLSLKVGRYWVGGNDANLSFKNIDSHLLQYVYGSLTLAVFAALLTGAITFLLLKTFKLLRQYRLRGLVKGNRLVEV
jgi:uncharacterized protein (DUF2062 family)